MSLNNFRAKLRKQAQVWRDAGIINDVQLQQLTQHQVNLEQTVENRFVFTLIVLGCILLVTVAIAVIAAYKQLLTREIKVALLLSLLAATNITGFYLCQQSIKAQLAAYTLFRKYLLGKSLLVLSVLLLGVNLSVVAQLFHINQENYEFLLLWGIGAIFMAYSYGEKTLAIFGLVIVLVSYLIFCKELPYLNNEVNWAIVTLEHIPLLTWLVFIPLAILCKSRITFILTAIAFTLTLQLSIKPFQYLSATSNFSWLGAFAFILPPALLWSYDDLLFPKVTKRHFQRLAGNLALACLCIFFYILGFIHYWQIPNFTLSYRTTVDFTLINAVTIDITILSIITVIQWLLLIQKKFNWKDLIILSLIVLCGLAPFWNYLNIDIPGAIVILYNVLLILFAFFLMSHAIQTRERKEFWGSILIISLIVITRMLEYQTDLILGSLIVAFCGITTIGASISFENNIKT
jgi:uncharacterized membrane protein